MTERFGNFVVYGSEAEPDDLKRAQFSAARRVLSDDAVTGVFGLRRWKYKNDSEEKLRGSIHRAKRVEALDDPRVLRTLEVGTLESVAYEAREKVAGYSVVELILREQAQGKPMSFSSSLAVGVQFSEILFRLHRREKVLGAQSLDQVCIAFSGRLFVSPDTLRDEPGLDRDIIFAGKLLRAMLTCTPDGSGKARVASGFGQDVQALLERTLGRENRHDARTLHETLCELMVRYKNRSPRSVLASHLAKLPNQNDIFPALEEARTIRETTQVLFPERMSERRIEATPASAQEKKTKANAPKKPSKELDVFTSPKSPPQSQKVKAHDMETQVLADSSLSASSSGEHSPMGESSENTAPVPEPYLRRKPALPKQESEQAVEATEASAERPKTSSSLPTPLGSSEEAEPLATAKTRARLPKPKSSASLSSEEAQAPTNDFEKPRESRALHLGSESIISKVAYSGRTDSIAALQSSDEETAVLEAIPSAQKSPESESVESGPVEAAPSVGALPVDPEQHSSSEGLEMDSEASEDAGEDPSDPMTTEVPMMSSLLSEIGLGRLHIRAPEDAVVFVDGQELGAGSILVQDVNRFATYSLRVHRRGHAPYTAQVSLNGEIEKVIVPKLERRR